MTREQEIQKSTRSTGQSVSYNHVSPRSKEDFFRLLTSLLGWLVNGICYSVDSAVLMTRSVCRWMSTLNVLFFFCGQLIWYQVLRYCINVGRMSRVCLIFFRFYSSVTMIIITTVQ